MVLNTHSLKLFVLFFFFIIQSAKAQDKYGSTLNLGVGTGGAYGYYKYVGQSFPFIHIDYEFDAHKNLTIAPSLNLYSFSNTYYWGSKNDPYKDYIYRERAVQIAAKVSYYLDDLLKAGSKWDFYGAGSLGFTFVKGTWENGYQGNKGIYSRSSPLYLDIHVGAEYHVNQKIGLFIDLSTGVNTIGLAIHQ
jgi:hypothetical protein